MFSRKTIGAIQILSRLDYTNSYRIHSSEIKKFCTLDDHLFRQAMSLLLQKGFIDRSITSPVQYKLIIPLNRISLYDIIVACHGDLVFGEIYQPVDSVYNFRHMGEWKGLTEKEHKIEIYFAEKLKNIKLSQLIPTDICPNTEMFF